MRQYVVDVTEIRHVPVRYTITAASVADAIEKAGNGETDDEQEKHAGEVVDRVVDATTLARVQVTRVR